jgi:hypothetical protein
MTRPDRANAVATTVFAIVADGMRQWLHGDPLHPREIHAAVAAALRDEFADVERTARGERELPDD